MCITSTQRNIANWIKIGASDEIINWIKNGVSWNFKKEQNPFVRKNYAFSKVQVTFIDNEINALLKRSAIKQVDYTPKCVSAIGCVPKKGNKWRLIVDLRELNSNINCPYFKNEGIDTVCDYLESGDNFVTFDLKDGFQHIPVNDNFKTFLGFQWRNKYYVWNVLPFGLNVSPWFFNKVIRAFVEYTRQQNHRLVVFVDDGLLIAKPDVIEEQKSFLLKVCKDLGLNVNYEKSQLTPTTTIQFIGYIISSVHESGFPWISIPTSRINKLRHDIKRALTSGYVNARFLARICGQCISFAKAVLPAKLLLRNLYALLATKTAWSDKLCLSNAARSDLDWWFTAVNNWNGRKIEKRVIEQQVFTDSSDIGWGAVCNDKEAQGLWTKEQSFNHINQREFLTVLLAVLSFRESLRGKHIQIVSDNIATVAYINHLGGPSEPLTKIARALWSTAHALGITMEAKHLSGSLNIHADSLSRMLPQSTYSWSLHPRIYEQIEAAYGPHTIDRFADITNHRCPAYNSLFYDPLTQGVDALAQQDWGTHNNFVNAPFALLPRVLKVIAAQKATATIIAPYWPAQTWFRTLQKLLVKPPLKLPKSSAMWILGKNPEPLKNTRWKLYAWKVSGKNV